VSLQSGGLLDARLDAELTNETSHDIRLAPCALSLERENVAGGWDQVWSLACGLLRLDPAILIPAGASRQVPVHLTGGTGTSWPSVSLDGRYRLRFWFFPSDELIARMSAVTNRISAKPVVSNEFAFSASSSH
jgi:hypothetical protein